MTKNATPPIFDKAAELKEFDVKVVMYNGGGEPSSILADLKDYALLSQEEGVEVDTFNDYIKF